MELSNKKKKKKAHGKHETFYWFTWGLIYQSDEITEIIGHIGRIAENIGKYRAIY